MPPIFKIGRIAIAKIIIPIPDSVNNLDLLIEELIKINAETFKKKEL